MTPHGAIATRRLTVGGVGRARRGVAFLAFGGVAALALALVLGVGLGTVAISPADTLAILAERLLGIELGRAWTPATETIVWELRLPRVLTAMVVGTGLAVAGATFQGLLRNPLADPYVLGTASGAALGEDRQRVGRRDRDGPQADPEDQREDEPADPTRSEEGEAPPGTADATHADPAGRERALVGHRGVMAPPTPDSPGPRTRRGRRRRGGWPVPARAAPRRGAARAA